MEVKRIVISSILIAIGIGVAIGIVIVIAILITRINPTHNSLTDVRDYPGKMAEVTLSIAPNQPGSILIRRESTTVKMRAISRDQQVFQVGDRVVIVEVHEGQAWVTSAE